jgi:hypothetical protein
MTDLPITRNSRGFPPWRVHPSTPKEQTDDRNRRSHTDPGHVLPGRSPSLRDFGPCTRLTFTVGRDVGSATPWPWS